MLLALAVPRRGQFSFLTETDVFALVSLASAGLVSLRVASC